MSCEMYLNTELRKLRPAELFRLGTILNISDAWKKLMAIVPKEGNVPRFTSEHIIMVEQATYEHKRTAAEIFLKEWSSMGRKRPTLEMLLELLVKAELFRAADYVACDILKQEKPKRPDNGPAASIDTSDAAINELLEEQQMIPKIIDTNSLISGCSIEKINKMYPDSKTISEETLVLHEAVNENLSITAGNTLNHERSTDIVLPEIMSDLMKFSMTGNYEAVNERVDRALISASEQQLSTPTVDIRKETSDTENLSDKGQYHTYHELPSEISSQELPVFLNNPVQSTTIHNIEMISSGYLPVFLNNSIQSAAVTNEEMSSSDLPVCLKQ